MPTLNFTKMNGAGNGFILLDNRDASISLTADQIKRLCNRHRGIGADALLILEKSTTADWSVHYFNADGTEAQTCGNGAHCFTLFANRITPAKNGNLTIETLSGNLATHLDGGHVTLDIAQPGEFTDLVSLDAVGTHADVYSIRIGVPHAIVMVDDLEGTDVQKFGRALRHHPHFQPRGTNVNFVKQLGPQDLAVRTYERGVEGESPSCATGAVASALVFASLTGASSPIRVRSLGNDTLTVSFKRNGDKFSSVTLTGPAEFIFDGTITL